MLVKQDYMQFTEPKLELCTDKNDEHIKLWWPTVTEDGESKLIELQMSARGAIKLAYGLKNAAELLIDLT